MKKILFFLALVCLIFPAVASADALGSGLLQESVGSVGLEEDIETSVGNIISAVLAVTGTIFLILTVAAGIMWMTAGGNEDKITKAKKIIIGTTIGLAICLFAYTITYFVTTNLTKAGGEEGNCSCVSTEIECPNGIGSGSCPAGQHCCI